MNKYPIMGVTGNRPEKLTSQDRESIINYLENVITIFKKSGGSTLIQGGALGVDQWCAKIALSMGLDVYTYAPFPTQHVKWSQEDQELYKNILNQSKRVTYAGNRPHNKYYFQRNEQIVNDSNILLAVHDITCQSGGAISTLNYAKRNNRPIIDVTLGKKITHENINC